jgi:hypothetical protein
VLEVGWGVGEGVVWVELPPLVLGTVLEAEEPFFVEPDLEVEEHTLPVEQVEALLLLCTCQISNPPSASPAIIIIVRILPTIIRVRERVPLAGVCSGLSGFMYIQ